MLHCVTVLPQKQNIQAQTGANLLQLLRGAGLAPDAPCGGNGRCGKCRVRIDGQEVLACQTVVDRDMVVTVASMQTQKILTDGIAVQADFAPMREGYLLAFDIGTTTVAGYLLSEENGQELACESAPNPQASFGADVISRIQAALDGQMEALTGAIRHCVEAMTRNLCEKAHIHPNQIGLVSVVGNPAMQQLFLGISPENLAQIPFAPVLTRPETTKAAEYIPICENATLLIVPNISGYVGADTVSGVLATKMAEEEILTLLVDIGTNGEMVLGNKHRMLACATAAGPALEGANIQFGMRASAGAIDRVWLEDSQIQCRVIGAGKALGICGSGLIDAVAVGLQSGLINERGRIQNESHRVDLTDGVFLTQEDIRQVQMAKGAIAAGIALLAQQWGVSLEQIQRVYLAGAFGTFMDAGSACRVGLLPAQLEGKITAVGNAAGSGAKQMACSEAAFVATGELVRQIETVELAQLPQFPKMFAKQMRFALPKGL